jgi:hypothetical protein
LSVYHDPLKLKFNNRNIYIKSEKGDFVLIKEKDLFIEKLFFSRTIFFSISFGRVVDA